MSLRGFKAATAIAVGLAATVAASSAQECTIASGDLIGMQARDGGCSGFSREFARKYLKIEKSQCEPPVQGGHMILGRCLADAAPPLAPAADPRSREDRLQALAEIVVEMNAEMNRMRAEATARDNEIWSELHGIRAKIGQ